MTITYARYVGRWSSCSRLASRLQPWVGGRECLSVVIGRDVTLPSSQVANGIHPFHPSIHPFQKVHSVFHHPPRLFLCICLPIRGARQPFFFFFVWRIRSGKGQLRSSVPSLAAARTSGTSSPDPAGQSVHLFSVFGQVDPSYICRLSLANPSREHGIMAICLEKGATGQCGGCKGDPESTSLFFFHGLPAGTHYLSSGLEPESIACMPVALRLGHPKKKKMLHSGTGHGLGNYTGREPNGR